MPEIDFLRISDTNSLKAVGAETMIKDIGKIQIDPGIDYLTNWLDSSGGFMLDRLLGTAGRTIVNKVVTGCGFTSYCLANNDNIILVSPRTRLIENKAGQWNTENDWHCFYFNRELDKDSGKQLYSISDLKDIFQSYCQNRKENNRPLKLFVTYDSFGWLVRMLETDFGIDINNNFRIVVDEAHCIIKDVRLKEYRNEQTLTIFLQNLFRYDNILFISATPLVKYLQNVKEFMANTVNYVELDWPNIEKVTTRQIPCKSAVNAFDAIYNIYLVRTDQNGIHIFDSIQHGDGNADYSYEAVIFLNSVYDIRKIVSKYVVKLGLIDVRDITVICADSAENEKDLTKTHPELHVRKSIPGVGEHHTTWTFVTRTAFEGVDFYSPSASTYVIANYNVSSLSLDILSDIRQIIGRQRLNINKFRNIVNIYYTKSNKVGSEEEFHATQRRKLDETRGQISIWESASPENKDRALRNLMDFIEKYPDESYLVTPNGLPQVNTLLLQQEEYDRDILTNHQEWYVRKRENYEYSPVTLALRNALDSVKTTEDRYRRAYQFFDSYPDYKSEFCEMLSIEGYSDLAECFGTLSSDRIKANSFNSTRIVREIKTVQKSGDIKDLIVSRFTSGEVYSKKEVKRILQDVYDALGLQKTAKASDILEYIDVSGAKKDGLKAFRIN